MFPIPKLDIRKIWRIPWGDIFWTSRLTSRLMKRKENRFPGLQRFVWGYWYQEMGSTVASALITCYNEAVKCGILPACKLACGVKQSSAPNKNNDTDLKPRASNQHHKFFTTSCCYKVAPIYCTCRIPQCRTSLRG